MARTPALAAGCTLTGTVVTLAGTSTFGGRCDDLAAGEHTVSVVLDAPAPGFSAAVHGQVTAVTTW